MATMNRTPQSTDIVGKTIARLLQTEWDHSEDYSSCNFYVEFTDGTLIWLLDDTMELVDTDTRNSLNLRTVDVDTSYPAFFCSSDGETGIGARVEQVLIATYDEVYWVLGGEHYLRSELAEGQTLLGLMDRQEFLYWASILEFFDYWTKEPVIFNNMARAN